MKNFSGYTLKDALIEIEQDAKYIVEIRRTIGVNKKYNKLTNPYIILNNYKDNYLELYVTYY